MDTVPITAKQPVSTSDGPNHAVYPLFNRELDDLPEPDQVESEESAQPVGQQFIDLYSWWRKKGEDTTPFVVVEKETGKDHQGKLVTKKIWILLLGDSNRYEKDASKMIKAINDGTLIPLTAR